MLRIRRYIKNTHLSELPVWSIGWQWFYDRGAMDEYPNLGWDFGIRQDAHSLKRSWIQEGWLFLWASRVDRRVFFLQEVLLCRWEVLRGIRQVPRGIYSDSFSNAEATCGIPAWETSLRGGVHRTVAGIQDVVPFGGGAGE